MAGTFLLEVATPERLLLREQATEAQIPAANGYLGILPHHSPLVAELGVGALSYLAAGRRYEIAVEGGWVEVLPDHVRVLATAAEKPDEIDSARALKAYERAQDRLVHMTAGVDVARALNALKRAQTRIQVSKSSR